MRQYEIHVVVTQKDNGKWGAKFHMADGSEVPDEAAKVIEKFIMEDHISLTTILNRVVSKVKDFINGIF